MGPPEPWKSRTPLLPIHTLPLLGSSQSPSTPAGFSGFRPLSYQYWSNPGRP